MPSPRAQRRSPLPGRGEAAARSQVGGGGGEEDRELGTQGLCRNAPVPSVPSVTAPHGQATWVDFLRRRWDFTCVFRKWGWGGGEPMRLGPETEA